MAGWVRLCSSLSGALSSASRRYPSLRTPSQVSGVPSRSRTLRLQTASLRTSSRQAARYRRFGDRDEEPQYAKDERSAYGGREPYMLSPSELWAKGREMNRLGHQSTTSQPLWQQRHPSRQRYDGRVYIAAAALGLGGVYYVFHLERVPETGRWRFMDVSVRSEHEMGEAAFRQTLQQYKGRILPPSDRRVQFVRRVASRIVAAAAQQQYAGAIHGRHLAAELEQGVRHADAAVKDSAVKPQWEVFVVQDPTPNAFVLPNGKIFVFTGILPICRDEDGLATVLGHEVAHQIARHSAEKVAGSKITMALSLLGELFVPGLYQSSQSALTLLKDLPNSRTLETEADRIGLWLMSAACYDPTHAPQLWQRMKQDEERQKNTQSARWEMLSTHPLSEKRMEKLQQWQSEALQIRQNVGCAATKVQQSQFANSVRQTISPTPTSFS